MAKKNGNSFYGMRLIKPNEKVIGFVWEADLHEYVLRYYHINKYNEYVCVLCGRSSESAVHTPKLRDALKYLKQTAKNNHPSRKIYIEEECYESLKRGCEVCKRFFT